jgi:hypothetical protein
VAQGLVLVDPHVNTKKIVAGRNDRYLLSHTRSSFGISRSRPKTHRGFTLQIAPSHQLSDRCSLFYDSAASSSSGGTSALEVHRRRLCVAAGTEQIQFQQSVRPVAQRPCDARRSRTRQRSVTAPLCSVSGRADVSCVGGGHRGNRGRGGAAVHHAAADLRRRPQRCRMLRRPAGRSRRGRTRHRGAIP